MSGVAAPNPRHTQEAARVLRWALALGAVAMVVIGIVLLALLTLSTANRELYERNYNLLLGINLSVALLLLLVIVWIVVRLLVRLRQGKFGSRLLVKLAAIFALVGLAPGLLIYVVSYQFVSRSIESWFDVKVEGALDAGLNLGRNSLDAMATDLANKTRVSAGLLAAQSDGLATLSLERVREQLGAKDVVLWSGSGQLLGSAGESRFDIALERPSASQMRAAKAQRLVTVIEGLDDVGNATPSATPNGTPAIPPNVATSPRARVKVLALVAPASLALDSEPRFLSVTQALPNTLVANAIAVQEAYSEYQERALARQGLKRMYIGTLTLSLFLAVFGAVLLAVLLGSQLARPLLLLAAGVREVAAGDLSPKAALQGQDELGGLTRSFADMTQQLAEARATVQRSMEQLGAARAHLQTILDNLTAGVMVLSPDGVLQTANPGAARILRLDLLPYQSCALAQIPGLGDFGERVRAQFQAFAAEHNPHNNPHGSDHWQQTLELGNAADSSAAGPDVTTLVVRGALLPGQAQLLVFDDISAVVSAQRAKAWAEVARRLAHEIKNPLTPIQLSAERLAHRLSAKLDPGDQAVLSKSVRIIVDQVEAMKRLVNEFRDYARLPKAELKALQLNQLVSDVLQLYEQDEARAPVHLLSELDPLCPPINADAAQLRQVLHNLIQNAQDATEAQATREVRIKTQWHAPAQRVRLLVQDNGPGFLEPILKRAFEPYVTTKTKGTGLGLAVVKKIADEHGARIELSNRVLDGQIGGAQVSLSFEALAQTSSGD